MKYISRLLLIVGLFMFFSGEAYALGNIGPDPADFNPSDDKFYFEVADVGVGSYLEANTSTLVLYFTQPNGQFQIINGNHNCSVDTDTDAPTSYTVFRNSNPAGDPHPGWPKSSWDMNCTANTYSVSGLPSVQIGNNTYYAATVQARITGSNYYGRVNAFKLQITQNGHMVSYYSNAGNKFALQDRISSSIYTDSNYYLKFGTDCTQTSNQTATLEWYDDDYGRPNQGNDLYFILQERPPGGGWATIITQAESRAEFTGDNNPGSASFTAKPDYDYRWIWYNVDKGNGIQFELPYNSVFYEADCAPPEGDISCSTVDHDTIAVSYSYSNSNSSARITRNGTQIRSYSNTNRSSSFNDSGLSPDTNYTYRMVVDGTVVDNAPCKTDIPPPPPTCTSDADRPSAGRIRVRSYNTETGSQASGATFRDGAGNTYTTATTFSGSKTLTITGTPTYYTMGSGTEWRGTGSKTRTFNADPYWGYTICIDMEPTWDLETDIVTWSSDTGVFEPLEPHQGSNTYSIVSRVCNTSNVRDNNGSQARHELRIVPDPSGNQTSRYVRMGSHRVLSGDGSTNGKEENNVDPDEWRWNSIYLNRASLSGYCSTFEVDFDIDSNELPDDLTSVQVCFRPFAYPDRRDNTNWISGNRECFSLSVPRRPFIYALGNDVHAGAKVSQSLVSEVCEPYGSGSVDLFGSDGVDKDIIGKTAGNQGARGQYAVSASGNINAFGTNNSANDDTYEFGSNGRYDIICRPDFTKLPITATRNGGAINDNQFDNLANGVTFVNGDLNIDNPGVGNPFTLDNGDRKTVIVDGNVTIRDDITLGSNTFSSVNDIPSFALIATGNITIARDVSEINGYFVSYGEFDTCDFPQGGNANTWAVECRNQLTVNGAVIAQKLLPRRTSGDTQSDTPAEIFRFRPELYLAPPPGLFGTAREIFQTSLFNERPPIF